jgi:hypothetical protein
VNPTLFALLAGAALGGFGWYPLGVWSSEFRRGKHEAERAWNNRDSYRR